MSPRLHGSRPTPRTIPKKFGIKSHRLVGLRESLVMVLVKIRKVLRKRKKKGPSLINLFMWLLLVNHDTGTGNSLVQNRPYRST